MPPWGRPPGGLDRRSRQEWEAYARQQWEQSRFEELGSDESELDGSYSRGTSSNMHYNSQSRQRHQDARYDDVAHGDDYDAAGYDERDEAWQTEMREKEEELVARARRRIRRAHLRGEANVDLTREELDAYERQRAREEAAKVPARKAVAAPPARAALPALKPKKKSSGGFFGGGASSSKGKGAAKTGKRASLPLQEGSPHDSSSGATPEQSPPVLRSDTPSGYFGPGPRASASPRASRSMIREAPGGSRQPASPPYPYDPPQTYRPSSRGSPTRSERSLPDDPDWAPRSRASSSTNLYSARDARDPFAYQVGGSRGFSGPASVSYSSLRRVPPPSGASGASTVRMSVSDMQGDAVPHRRVSTSGLSKELAETSSDEDSSESDDGGVDVAQPGASTAVARGIGGRVQARRGRR